MKALLFSGGLDSTAIAWWQRPDLCLTVDYGQRPASGEIAAAASLASSMGLSHKVLRIDLSGLGSGMLAGLGASHLAAAPEWWPYRNQMLITLAGMLLVSEGLKEIQIGAVATDVHADGQKPFIDAINKLMVFQEGAVRVVAPALAWTPLELLNRSDVPRSLLGATFSCHVMEYACGRCRGCQKHQETLADFDAAAKQQQRADIAP